MNCGEKMRIRPLQFWGLMIFGSKTNIKESEMKKIILCSTALLLATNAWAGDSSFDEGKALFNENCLTCHDAELDPPKAPPMFAVQNRYNRAVADRDGFIDKVTAFAMDPSEDKALMRMAVNHLGVMPNPGVDEPIVRKIAAYIHDETFAPPCDHWKAGMRIAKEQGDMPRFRMGQMRYNRMCAGKTEEPAVTPSGEE